jgi:protein-L-isoaspartate(D-aspartate) O-methyltransferase
LEGFVDTLRSLAPVLPAVVGLCLLALLAAGCGPGAPEHPDRPGRDPAPEQRVAERHRLVTELENQGIRDNRVLRAMALVPRHAFLPAAVAGAAYADQALPIGSDQTISQPYVVAAMTEALALQPGERVLEIGTGSGYQAAILAELTPHVFTIEIVPELAERAAGALARLGYERVRLRIGDGREGWPEEAPFDAILLTAAPDELPRTLLEQLAPGGRLVAPVGPAGEVQELVLVERGADGELTTRALGQVRFVPMTGAAR